MRDTQPVTQNFFNRDTATVAKSLLGTYLVHQVGDGLLLGEIVETEAYLTDDPAAHTFVGPTERNKAMFGPPGRAYIYLIYGMYYCMNCTTREEGVGEAVLIRALRPVAGIETMQQNRGKEEKTALCSGPGKLTQAMEITKAQYGVDLTNPDSPLRIEQGERQKGVSIVATPRVGVTKAADRLLRFCVEGSEFVSR